MKVLEIKDLNKKYGKKHVLKDVSFCLNEGEILGFIGPNGAGKTTTIKLILGLQFANGGEVLINGYNINTDREKAIERVGAIVENPDMYQYLSGRTNLEMVARLYKDVTKDRIEEVIKLVGLENRIDDKVSKYSLGMRQRLGIAAALINKPNLLILDEPTNGLDPEGIKELRELLKKLAKKEEVAVLISSHNLAELESFCNVVSIIQNGKVLKTSRVKDLKKNDNEYYLELDKLDGIDSLIKAYTKVKENVIKVMASKEEVADFIDKLVRDGFKIYECKMVEISLEDAFLQMTGGNSID